jgi:U3 small nucleolar ribonucleoprotein component
LGGLFGGKGEQMDAISFEPGSDRLLPPELEKLKKVIEVLEKRPQLGIVVQGRYDSKIDGEALRTERVKRALAEQMEVKLPLGEEPGPVAFNTAKTQKTLEKLLKMRAGDKAVTDFKAQYEKETGLKAKRVKPYLAVFGWESSDTAFYQAMFEELVKIEPLLDNELPDLAQRRAEAIVKELKAAGGLDPSRVTAGSSAPVEESSTDTVNTKLSLDVIKPAA